MPSQAKPFDFAAFEAAAAVDNQSEAASEKSYSQAELDAACAKAREEALSSMLAGEARNQSACLETIAARLSVATSTEIDGVAAHIDRLTALSREIIETFCTHAAAIQQTEAALALVDQFLKADPDTPPACLTLSSKTTKKTRTAIEKAVAAKDVSGAIAIEIDDALSPGELRFNWRGGAMSCSQEEVHKQIADLFSAAGTRARTSKETKS